MHLSGSLYANRHTNAEEVSPSPAGASPSPETLDNDKTSMSKMEISWTPPASRTSSLSAPGPSVSRKNSADARATEPPVTDSLDNILAAGDEDLCCCVRPPRPTMTSLRRGSAPINFSPGLGMPSQGISGENVIAHNHNNSRNNDPPGILRTFTGSPRRSSIFSPCRVLGEFDVDDDEGYDTDDLERLAVSNIRPPETTPQCELEEGMVKDPRRRSSAPPSRRRITGSDVRLMQKD